MCMSSDLDCSCADLQLRQVSLNLRFVLRVAGLACGMCAEQNVRRQTRYTSGHVGRR